MLLQGRVGATFCKSNSMQDEAYVSSSRNSCRLSNSKLHWVKVNDMQYEPEVNYLQYEAKSQPSNSSEVSGMTPEFESSPRARR